MVPVKGCGQASRAGPDDVTLPAPVDKPHAGFGELGEAPRQEDTLATFLGLRRALTIGCAMWGFFFIIDLAVVRYMEAGSIAYFALVRAGVLALTAIILARMYRSAVPSRRELGIEDVLAYTAPAIGIALLCVPFRGLASPYIPGCCLVLLGRSVTSQDPWRRGAVMSGIPIIGFFAVLLGSALFSSRVAAQLHDSHAITALLVNSAYVLSTYVFLVMCGHIAWSLRRQVFEARSLGRYRLKRRLASGGMGDVWLAYHPGLKRDVAVKILKPEEQERAAGAQARFEREVRATAELKHPNTVRVFDYGATEDGLWYYVMEFLEGETLEAHVDRLGPLPPARAVHIVGQAARALAEAHERGIVHRDIKPGNLFLTSLGGEHDFVKVIDFGIAKVAHPDGTMTGTGWVLGTPEYISPEVATGESADPRSDVYGLGAVLHFLLCGRPPFEAGNAAGLLFAHANHQASPPSSVLGKPLPSDVESVVLRALAKDPGERYANCAELALALASCRVAGKWTYGDATDMARKSSRPPTSLPAESLASFTVPKPAPVPSFATAGVVKSNP
jgi:serine/threonine-protein kinase